MKILVTQRLTMVVVVAILFVLVIGTSFVLRSQGGQRFDTEIKSEHSSALVETVPTTMRGVIDLSEASHKPSPLGTFPRTEVIDRDQARARGVKLPTEGVGGWMMEVRQTPDGVFVTQLEKQMFLTQIPIPPQRPMWRLKVPQYMGGEIFIVAAIVGSMPALGVGRPGEFTRLSWEDQRFQYVLVDFSGRWDIDQLINIARSLQ